MQEQRISSSQSFIIQIVVPLSAIVVAVIVNWVMFINGRWHEEGLGKALGIAALFIVIAAVAVWQCTQFCDAYLSEKGLRYRPLLGKDELVPYSQITSVTERRSKNCSRVQVNVVAPSGEERTIYFVARVRGRGGAQTLLRFADHPDTIELRQRAAAARAIGIQPTL